MLDPVEPRVLMNADTLTVQLATLPNDSHAHDLTAQLVNETVTVGAQAQTVQRIQVVDAAEGNAILAFGDLAEVRSIAIATDAASTNTVTLDLGSFGKSALPTIHIDGQGANDTLAYVGGGYDTITSVATGPNSGSVVADGVTTLYDGLEPVTLAASNTLTLQVSGAAVLQDGPTANTLQLSATGAETQIFTAPTRRRQPAS